jgi:hypothetical protein
VKEMIVRVKFSWVYVSIAAAVFLVVNFVLLSRYHRHDENLSYYRTIDGSAVLESPRSNRKYYEPLPPLSKLPGFATDYSEYVFSAVLDYDHTTNNVFATTFMLCHQTLRRKTSSQEDDNAFKVLPSHKKQWSKAVTSFAGIDYKRSGQRKSYPAFYCRIRHSLKSESYLVPGIFVPTGLTSDMSLDNLKGNVDILRCELNLSRTELTEILGVPQDLIISIVRQTEILFDLIHFKIPWQHRQVGYLTAPEKLNRLDYWYNVLPTAVQGMNRVQSLANRKDPVYFLCVSTNRVDFSKPASLVGLKSFMDYYVTIGISHIVLPVLFNENSKQLETIRSELLDPLSRGLISLVPLCNSLPGMLCNPHHMIDGLLLPDELVSELMSNVCLYSAKGIADYMMIVAPDELILFDKRKHEAFNEIIGTIDINPRNAFDSMSLKRMRVEELQDLAHAWQGGRGWADKQAHPLCSIRLDTFRADGNKISSAMLLYQSASESFADKFPKVAVASEVINHKGRSLLPTRVVMHATEHHGGSCNLPGKWNHCLTHTVLRTENDLETAVCNDVTEVWRLGVIHSNGSIYRFHNIHSLYEAVQAEDTKFLDGSTAQIFRFKFEYGVVSTTPNELQSLRGLIPADSGVNTHLGIPDLDIGALPLVPKIGSDVSSHSNLMKLPQHTPDFSDYILSSLLERVSDSYDLFVTTFFLCHEMLIPRDNAAHEYRATRISTQGKRLWREAFAKFKQPNYTDAGVRVEPPEYYCKIWETAESVEPYIVRGRFIPNRLTLDGNSNRRLDTLRCKMHSSSELYRRLARSDKSVVIEILRGNQSLAKFSVPWATRQTGYLLGPQVDSTFDPWKGFDPARLGQWEHDDIYLCVPGLEMPMSSQSAHIYLEFIQYHLNIGVSHIFLATALAWDGQHNRLLRRLLRSYIDEGLVTLVTGAHDDVDFIYSTSGLQWGRDNVKIFYVNMCTYLAMGTANYVGVWDFDEFLLIHEKDGRPNNISGLLAGVDRGIEDHTAYLKGPGKIGQKWSPHRSMADGQAHPLCYLSLAAVPTFPRAPFLDRDPNNIWLGQRFAHNSEKLGHPMGLPKSIRPTRTVMQSGLHLAGSCRLPYPWNGCASPNDNIEDCPQYAANDKFVKLSNSGPGSAPSSLMKHSLYDTVLNEDAKLIDPITEAVINHIQYFRNWYGASQDALNSTGEYAVNHFTKVLDALDARDLVLPITLPDKVSAPVEMKHEMVDIREIIDSATELAKSQLGAEVVVDEPSVDFTEFPSFSADYSEIILGSIIESRSSLISDRHRTTQYFLSTLLFSTEFYEQILDTSVDSRSNLQMDVHPRQADSWKRLFANYLARKNRLSRLSMRRHSHRVTDTVVCYLRNLNGSDTKQYSVPGTIRRLNNKPDSAFVLIRCPVRYVSPEDISKVGAALVADIRVNSKLLSNFQVSWASRVNCKLMDTATTSKVLRVSPSSDAKSVKATHLLLRATNTIVSKQSLPIVLESIQHHLLLGFQHIYLTVPWGSESSQFRQLQQVCRSFLKEQVLTIIALTTGGDYSLTAFNVLGAVWLTYQDPLVDSGSHEYDRSYDLGNDIIFVIISLLVPDSDVGYLGYWDVNSFYISTPELRFTELLSVIAEKKCEHKNTTRSMRQSVLTGDRNNYRSLNQAHNSSLVQRIIGAHCVVRLPMRLVANSRAQISFRAAWIGGRYAHLPENRSVSSSQDSVLNAVLPVHVIIASKAANCLHCQHASHQVHSLRPRPVHELRAPEDASGAGYLLHFQTDDHQAVTTTLSSPRSDRSITNNNDYAKWFYESVKKALAERNLDLLIYLPSEPRDDMAVAEQPGDWTTYSKYYRLFENDART